MVEDGQQVLGEAEVLRRNGSAILAEDVGFIFFHEDEILIIAQPKRVDVRNGSELLVKAGQVVPADETVAYFDPFAEPIIAEASGRVRFEDIVLGTTLKEEINEDTGKIEKKITEFPLESLQPRIIVVDEDEDEVASYYLPGQAYLNVDDGEEVVAGRVVAKLLKESVKTRDITGGLPRVGELFEARRSKSPAVLAKIGGLVKFKGISKGKRSINVVDPFGKEYKHAVPMGKHLLVRDGDTVEAGELLCDGGIDPHDILQILGETRTAALSRKRDPGGVPAAGRQDQRQAHWSDHSPDDEEDRNRGSGRYHVHLRATGGSPYLQRGEPQGDAGRRAARRGAAVAVGHHPRLAEHRFLHLGGIVPGDHARAYQFLHCRFIGPAERAEGERDHRPPDSLRGPACGSTGT